MEIISEILYVFLAISDSKSKELKCYYCDKNIG